MKKANLYIILLTGLPETDDENSEIIVKPKRVKR